MAHQRLKKALIDADEVSKIIYWMKRIYVNHMKESRGEKYDYLRMDLDLSVNGEVRVTMTD